jgi:CDP-diglyceride synthetase
MLLGYSSWVYSLVSKRNTVSWQLVLMMGVMVGVVSVVTAVLALQLCFEAMNFENQFVRVELWAVIVFSKLLPEAVTTLAIAFAIVFGVYVGRNNVASAVSSKKKESDATQALLASDEHIPKAYVM